MDSDTLEDPSFRLFSTRASSLKGKENQTPSDEAPPPTGISKSAPALRRCSAMNSDTLEDPSFRLFSQTPSNEAPPPSGTPKPASVSASAESFSDLGLSEWADRTCRELGMKRPTPVQAHCIPEILAGKDVLGLAQTGSGKTAAFALPILNCLAKHPYGVFVLVVTPTRELAYQIAEQFRALGASLRLRCAVVVGGMDALSQAQALIQRPHVVIGTPGRIKVLLESNPDISSVFSKTKFLVLDEADRVLDVGFEEELKVIFRCLPKGRQTLLFSATMTNNLHDLLDLSANKAYFYEEYEK